MVEQVPGTHRITLAGDKGDDTREFARQIRELAATPHVAQNTSGRRSAIDRRTTRHPGYAISQRRRKCVEEVLGWLKTVGVLRKTGHHAVDRVHWVFVFAAAAYHLVRLRTLAPA